jgi:hypothetical protein
MLRVKITDKDIKFATFNSQLLTDLNKHNLKYSTTCCKIISAADALLAIDIIPQGNRSFAADLWR